MLSSCAVGSRKPDIAAAFAEHYKASYARQARSSRELERPLRMNIPLQRLSKAASCSLECPFTLEEVGKSIPDINSGKTPGPDGFSAEYFRSFVDLLGTYLVDFFIEAVEKTIFPPRLILP